MGRDFDVIVVGSGAGGAAFATRCARQGKEVLLIERGFSPNGRIPPLDEQATLIEKQPYDDREILIEEKPARLYMGGVVGGSTAVYGGAMLRPAAIDFHPGESYGEPHLPKSLRDWPIDYDTLAPYYDEAEALYHVSGDPEADYGPLPPPGKNLQLDVIKMAPVNERLMTKNQRAGLKPFRLPLAIDTDKCQRCDACAGFLCPHDARRSAAHLIRENIDRPLHLMSGVEVDRILTFPDGRIEGVCVRDRQTDRSETFRARVYALAAGAIGSAAILLKSGFEHPQLGRNYMMHYNPIAVGIFLRSTGAADTFVKQVGFTDFYHGIDLCPEKMGLVQSLPAPGPLMMQKTGMGFVPKPLLNMARGRMLPLAGIVEDLPRPENHVYVKPNGAIGLTHDFSKYDRERGRFLGLEMCEVLKRAGAIYCHLLAFPSREHVAHQCGTIRFGNDPKHAVVDADCRMFGHENLFVVDGSILPTSTGVGPSLTIVANALRVADAALTSL